MSWSNGWKTIYLRHEWTAILKRRRKKKAAKLHKKAIEIALGVKRNKEKTCDPINPVFRLREELPNQPRPSPRNCGLGGRS